MNRYRRYNLLVEALMQPVPRVIIKDTPKSVIDERTGVYTYPSLPKPTKIKNECSPI